MTVVTPPPMKPSHVFLGDSYQFQKIHDKIYINFVLIMNIIIGPVQRKLLLSLVSQNYSHFRGPQMTFTWSKHFNSEKQEAFEVVTNSR